MSSIRLSGSSSGYYDLTVPAVAGTNSIDLSNLPVKDSNGNLGINTGSATLNAKLVVQGATNANNIEINGNWIQSFNRGSSAGYQVLPIYSSGITTPNQPRFLAVPAANANVSYGSQKHTYTAVAYNVGSHYDTSNGRFTAPIGGFYWFEHRMAMSGGNSSTLEAKIYKNGSEFARSYLDCNGSTNTDRVQTIIQLSAGDYVEAYTHWASSNLNNYLSQGSGSTQNAITCFMGALVG